MRGKDDLNLFQKVVKGITPAYAGKSGNGCQDSGAVQDHPRLCGEKSMDERAEIVETGSPPPMRGKDGVKQYTADRVGITPAYAGKRFKSFVDGLRIEDHPRLCGEKCRQSDVLNRPLGSPPPMRGKD